MDKTTRRGFAVASTAVVAASMLGPGKRSAEASTRRSFADAVLSAFDRHRLVALGEGGTHGLQEHFDALTILLADPRTPDVVDDMVVEFGNARHQATVDRFTAGRAVDNADLRPAWRDTTQSPLATWDAPVFEQVFRTVRAVNADLPERRRIRVLLGDPPIDWSRTTTRAELGAYLLQRDSHAASVIQREVLDRGRRALICYGADHVLHGSLIESQLGERPYVIASLVPLAGDPGGLGARLARLPRRAVIPTSVAWLGSFDAGLLFPAARRGPGGEPSNFRCGVPVGSLIDAGLYLGPSAELTVSRENPAGYLDPAYWTELRRRNGVQGGIADLEAYRREQPVRFTPRELPEALRCPAAAARSKSQPSKENS
ncbi:hypothetical protein [Flindersiella endophytica]